MTTKKAARTGKDRIRGGGATGSRTRAVPKKTERRAGDKTTRVRRGGQKQRQVSLEEPKQRRSGLERKRPMRSEELAREERSGAGTSRTSASRKKSPSGRRGG